MSNYTKQLGEVMVKLSFMGNGSTVGEGAALGAIGGGLIGISRGSNLSGAGDIVSIKDKENHKIKNRLINMLVGGLGGAGIGTVMGGALGGIRNLSNNNDAIARLAKDLKTTKTNLDTNINQLLLSQQQSELLRNR